MMKKWSSRWIDLTQYKTKDILLSVVRDRVPSLEPANKAETFYKCLCIVHKEKNPSMKFFFNKHIPGWGYNCFGCGRSGDVFTFLMQYERWEFWDAMLYVTRRYMPGVPVQSAVTNARCKQLRIPFPAEWIQLTLHFPAQYQDKEYIRSRQYVLGFPAIEAVIDDLPF